MTRVVHEDPVLAAANAPLPKKRSGIKRWLLRLVIFLVVVCGGLAVVYLTAPVRYNVLLVGSDQRGTERARSDVMLVVSIPKTAPGELILLTIPRDTKVEDPEYGLQKMTHFYAFGDRPEGSVLGNIALTQSVIERELDIPIHATAEVTFASFEQLIDEVGGLTITSGTVNGQQALELVRDRYRPGGDFARTADQREIVEALIGKFQDLGLIDKVYSYLTTNYQTRLSYDQFQAVHFAGAYILGHVLHPGFPGMREEVLPGSGTSLYTPGFDQPLYYFVLDSEKTTQLLEAL